MDVRWCQFDPERSRIQLIAKITNPINTSMTGLNKINTTAAGLINPMTKSVAHRLANFSRRLASVCARASKSWRVSVSASRYQPVDLLEMRRRCFGRRAGLDVGVLGGVGVVDVFGVGEKEDSGVLVCE